MGSKSKIILIVVYLMLTVLAVTTDYEKPDKLETEMQIRDTIYYCSNSLFC